MGQGLYDSSENATPAPPAAHPLDAPARILYDGNAASSPVPSGAPAAADPGRVLYGPSMLTSAIEQRAAELEVAGVDAATRQHAREKLLTIARDTGLPEPEMMTIANVVIDEHLGALRPVQDPAAAAFALEQQMQTWNEEIREHFRLQYGKDGEEMLARVKRFVQAHPTLAASLQGAAGSNPEIVLGIAAHVFSSGWRG